MKVLFIALPLTILWGCTSTVPLVEQQPPGECPGKLELPAELVAAFESIEDEALLKAALGAPKKGGLCRGKAYKLKENQKDLEVTLYRAWNSTNPQSRLGKWWAFDRPQGKVRQYRSDYAICYQWSPLDRLTHCTLKPGAELVVGTGQSAECSEYLTYPSSAAKQIYIEDASASLSDCRDYDALFSWESPVKQFMALP